ncbi:la-related protein 7 homolog [Dermatophagoides farinae]|uniref:la-related protein 7 homolog n=1 Tax=Dermatophagoides farinae TaxID=6954 RepID=UPI003F5E37DC
MSKEKNFVNQNIGQQNTNICINASIIIDTNDDDVDNDSDVDIYEKIRKQIGFYFSSSNIHYDKFMQRLIGISGQKSNDNHNNMEMDDNDNDDDEDHHYGIRPVHLKEFLRFNKIRELTNSLDDLLRAFNIDDYPDLVDTFLARHDLNYDSETQSLQRLKPYHISIDNLNNRTIYLEGFDPQISRIDDILRGYLEILGPILSIRVQKRSKLLGFAFVEYEHEKDARLFCNWFNNNNNNNRSDEMNTTVKMDKLLQIEKELQNIKQNDNEIRVSSKSEWNHCKNRYLRTQRRCRIKSMKREQEIQQSFEL